VKHLRLLRESQKLSQQKLADQFNLAQSQIQSYETGAYEPDINTMIAMADFFGTSVDYLVGRTDTKRNIEHISDHSLSEAEKTLLIKYRGLLPNKRKILTMVLDALADE
jgi:transcriptional regulator with XRE-family HTH domain